MRLFSDNNSSLNSYVTGDVKEELQKFTDACQAMLERIEKDSQEAEIRDAFIEIIKEEVARYIKKIIDTTHKAGKKVCICGEAASNRDWLERFISMGLDEISIRVWE